MISRGCLHRRLGRKNCAGGGFDWLLDSSSWSAAWEMSRFVQMWARCLTLRLKAPRLICKICLIVLYNYLRGSLRRERSSMGSWGLQQATSERKATMKINCLCIECDRSLLIGRTEQMGYSETCLFTPVLSWVQLYMYLNTRSIQQDVSVSAIEEDDG